MSENLSVKKTVGELERRIRSIIPKLQGLEGYSPLPSPYDFEVMRVLEEAKREFPLGKEGAEIGSPNFKGFYTLCMEIDEWFVKWFGQVSPAFPRKG